MLGLVDVNTHIRNISMSSASYDILCAHVGDKRAALVLHFGAWLPAESNSHYAAYIKFLRHLKRYVIQSTNFVGSGNSSAVRQLFMDVIDRCEECGARDLITIVPPNRVDMYCKSFGFNHLGTQDVNFWQSARSMSGNMLPTSLIRLQIDNLPKRKLALLKRSCKAHRR